MLEGKTEQLGQIGLISDKEAVTLPPNAWSEMQNMRCIDGSIGNFAGYEKIDDITGTPETINVVRTGVRNYIVYASRDSIHSYSAGVETDISQKVYSTGGKWDSCSINGIAIFNNGVNNPQFWGGEGLCEDLPYDSTGESSEACTWGELGLKAKVIREFRYHLFALDITDCAGRNPRKVWWSDPAEPGTLPITWDPILDDYDAGFVDLSATPGKIVDALSMRDTLQIYKTDAVYSCTYTGRQDNQIFNFRPVTTKMGIYSRNCVADIGGVHFLVTDGDIVLYDGASFKSIADERVRNLFFDNVSRAFYEATFCAYYDRTGEVWLCYPTEGNEYCNKALVWNSQDNTWTTRDLPGVNAAIFAIVDRKSDYTWATLPYATWADWGIDPISPDWTTWGNPIDNQPIYDSLVMGGANKLFEFDRTNQADGVNQVCYCRRTHLDLGNKADWHQLLKLYPIAEGDPFSVRVGSQIHVTDDPVWTPYQTFTPATDHQLDFRVTGPLHCIEYYSDTDARFKVSGHEFAYEKVSRR